jgi:carbon-monoxide dehydrogenase small subunit
MLMTLIAFLRDREPPSPVEIREALSGHLCRCTGYQHIVDAVLLASADAALLDPPSS